jgi:DNA polymerase V
LFSDAEKENEYRNKELLDEKVENKIQRAVIDIKRKYGKNAILKGMNLEEGGTTIARNNQIGGHKC